MPDPTLHQVTLNTGHVRASPRSEVSAETIEALRPLLERALRGEKVGVPGRPGYTMSGGVQGWCCAVTLWREMGDGPERQPVPILTAGVCPEGAEESAKVWAHLHQGIGAATVTDPEGSPAPPWCADQILTPALLGMEAMEWTGDWARCVAWTWIEMVDRPPTPEAA